MLKNSQLKRKLLFVYNQSLLKAYKLLKVCQEQLLISLQDSVRCVYQKEDTPRQEIARKDYRRALNTYIDAYSYVLSIKEDIKQLQEWEANE